MSTAVLTVLDMPVPRSRLAPRKFKGDYKVVREFVEQVEKLLTKNNVVNGKEKCEALRQYCSSKVKQTVEGMPPYAKGDWDQFKTMFLQAYDAERSDLRYTEKYLISQCRYTRDQPISSLKDFKRYQRHYYSVAGWLLSKKRIDDTKFSKYFWCGLHKSFRKHVEAMILLDEPNHDLTKPFGVDQVVKAVEKVFMRTRFDADESDNEDDVGSSDEEYDSDTESEEDSDDEDMKPRRYRRKSSSRTKIGSPDDGDKTDKRQKISDRDKVKKVLRGLEKEEVKAQKQDEVESLIKQLSQMSLDDPNYAMLYYRAINQDPRVESIIRSPVMVNRMRSGSQGNGFPPRNMFQRPFECYGCGGKDHGLGNCPEINNYIVKNVVRRGQDNKYIMADGSRIFRNPGETFVQAIKRLLKDKGLHHSSHFITVGQSTITTQESNLSSDEEEEYVYAAERVPKITKEKRKDKFAGVYPNPISRSQGKGKEKEQPVASQSRSTVQSQSQTIPTQSHVREQSIPVQVPVEVHPPPIFNPEYDDEIMEDVPVVKTKVVRNPRVPHASSVSKDVDAQDVLEKVFAAPIVLPVRDLLGLSKDLSKLMADAIRYKRTSPKQVAQSAGDQAVNHAVSYAGTKISEELIKVPMRIGGIDVDAIIDTGSTINIMCKDVFKQLSLPINKHITPIMNDANGGSRVMVGLVEQVPIGCGSIATNADVFVADHVSFEVLLGRPWQKGNSVSIEERSDGTYLLFRDRVRPSMFYELLAVPSKAKSRMVADESLVACAMLLQGKLSLSSNYKGDIVHKGVNGSLWVERSDNIEEIPYLENRGSEIPVSRVLSLNRAISEIPEVLHNQSDSGSALMLQNFQLEGSSRPFDAAQECTVNSVSLIDEAQECTVNSVSLIDEAQECTVNSVSLIDEAQECTINTIPMNNGAQECTINTIPMNNGAQECTVNTNESERQCTHTRTNRIWERYKEGAGGTQRIQNNSTSIHSTPLLSTATHSSSLTHPYLSITMQPSSLFAGSIPITSPTNHYIQESFMAITSNSSTDIGRCSDMGLSLLTFIGEGKKEGHHFGDYIASRATVYRKVAEGEFGPDLVNCIPGVAHVRFYPAPIPKTQQPAVQTVDPRPSKPNPVNSDSFMELGYDSDIGMQDPHNLFTISLTETLNNSFQSSSLKRTAPDDHYGGVTKKRLDDHNWDRLKERVENWMEEMEEEDQFFQSFYDF
jgi:hypothetical protein